MAQDETALDDIIADAENSMKKLKAYLISNAILPKSEQIDEEGIKKANERVRNLNRDELKNLANLLQDEVNSFGRLFLPPDYVDLLNDLHERTYTRFCNHPLVQEMLPIWFKLAPRIIDMNNGNRITALVDTENGWLTKHNYRTEMTPYARRQLDDLGLTSEKSIMLFNIVAQSTKAAWEECLGIEDPVPAQHVIGYKLEKTGRKKDFSVFVGEENISYYFVNDHSVSMLDMRVLIDLAHHEPQHDIQFRIERADPDLLARRLNSTKLLKRLFRIGSVCPPGVFFGTEDDRLGDLALKAYRLSLREMAAFHQGSAACMRFAHKIGIPLDGEFLSTLTDYPDLAGALPADLRNCYRPVSVVSRRPGFKAKVSNHVIGGG